MIPSHEVRSRLYSHTAGVPGYYLASAWIASFWVPPSRHKIDEAVINVREWQSA